MKSPLYRHKQVAAFCELGHMRQLLHSLDEPQFAFMSYL